MKNKKLAIYFLTGVMMAGSFTGCGGQSTPPGTSEDPIDKTQTQLFVYNFDGGVGTDWLRAVESKFEKAYENTSFEDGKTGIDIRITPGKDTGFTISKSNYDVIFTEGVRVNSLAAQGEILNINDIVTTSLSDVTGGKETGTIADKMKPEFAQGLTALDGNYYAIPHYETYSGIFYDKDVFEEYGFYFLEGGDFCTAGAFENGVYTGTGKLSVGPDGVRGTTDDGQPSSYEEFFKMMDKMVKETVTPFIWSGQYELGYLLKAVNAIWANYSGADAMNLCLNYDSNEFADKTVLSSNAYSFDSNGNPIIVNEEVTPATGYKASAQVGKYYGLAFLEKIMSSSAYSSLLITDVLSHLDAQEEYIYSNLENKPIAMLIEGSYWYNEASEAFARSVNDYKQRAKNRRFSMMELPRQVSGQVQEGEGTKNTLFSDLNSYAVVNINVGKDAGKMKAAKTFLQYCYSQEELVEFTCSTGVYRGLNYEVDTNALQNLDCYKSTLCDIRAKSDVVSTISHNKIYMNNESAYCFEYGSKTFSSKVKKADGKTEDYMTPVSAFKQGITAAAYFQGSIISESDWIANHSKYFE